MKRNILISILFFSFITLYSYGSSDVVDKLKGYVHNMETFNKYFPQEKVYLHFDNTGYFRGETIWFKAYVLRDDRGEWTDLSKVLYVELLSPMGDIMETKKLHIQDGQADGCFKLDSLFYNGFYEVRAYTRYMLNWDAKGIFSRVFPVFNEPKVEGDYSQTVMEQFSYKKRLPSNREQNKNTEKLNVKFYPEGGHLIQGLKSCVAFEVTDHEGMPIKMHGFLVLSDGKTVPVATMYEGRGRFFYLPIDKQATLKIEDEKGQIFHFVLPIAESSGYVLNVDNSAKERLDVRITKTGDCDNVIGFVLVKNGNVEAFDVVEFDERGQALRSFNKYDMSAGINQLALINSKGEILASRFVFVYPQTVADTIQMDMSNIRYAPYNKILIKAKTIPNTTFSVSVRDVGTEINGSQSDVATWLLLSSDLKGYVNNPAYYFECNDDVHRRNVDLLMLVQGWQRYDLQKMDGYSKFEKIQPIEDGLYLCGRVYPMQKKQIVENIAMRVSLYNEEGYSLSGKTFTKNNGYYAFRLPDCEGCWTLLLNTKKENQNAKFRIGIDRNLSPVPRPFSFKETQYIPLLAQRTNSQDMENSIKKSDKYLLREINVKGQRRYKSARDSWENEQRGAYAAFIRYNCMKAVDLIVDSGETIPGIYEWLSQKNKYIHLNEFSFEDISADKVSRNNEKIPSADTRTDSLGSNAKIDSYGNGISSDGFLMEGGPTYKGRPIVWIWNNQYLTTTGTPHSLISQGRYPTVFDPALLPPPEMLDDYKNVYISEKDIWTHHILCPDLYAYNPVTIFLYSVHAYHKKQKGIRRTFFEGYAPKVEFYSPDYSAMTPMPDYRRTLYWNPNVITDKNGEAKIEFYNNSTCRQLVISAEGITKDGRTIIYK